MLPYGPAAHEDGLSIRSTGHGPRLVLLHGGSGSRTHWARNVAPLARAFQVITIDLPGFGESEAPPADTGADRYLETVARGVLRAVADQPFHLVGFSFGGAVAAGVSALLSEQGQTPLRLSLISPAGFGKPVQREITLEKVKHIDETDVQALRAATARNLGRWMLAREPQPQDEAVDIHLRNVGLARFDSRRISHRPSLVAHLQAARVPTQILLGRHDPLVFPSLPERVALLQQALPEARVEVIDNGGHWLAYEASDAVNQRIRQFHL